MRRAIYPLCLGHVIAVALTVTATASAAQELQLPRASPRARVTQTVGVSTITVDFGRPGVKGREIWGDLVPYDGGDPLPWRTGADEPTTIELSHDAEIEGQPVTAGRYGLYTVPAEEEWTLILNRNSGDFFSYDPEEDVVRLSVEPRSAPYRERLDFEFEELDDPGSTTIVLRWERVGVPFVVSFDVEKIVLEEARAVLAQEPESWVPWYQAADFVLEHDGDLDEALRWIAESIERSETRANLATQAGLLEKSGREEEAAVVRVKLEEYERDTWQRVEDIFDRMRIEAGSWVADVGAGDGWLASRLSQRVGPAGHVFAVEVDDRAIVRLHEASEDQELTNVTVVRGATTTPRLPPRALDAVVIVNAYHEMGEYRAMLQGMSRALEAGGRLVLVEPMSESSRGLSRAEQVRNHDLELELAREELEAAGFEILEATDPFVEMPWGGTEWLLVGRKPEE